MLFPGIKQWLGLTERWRLCNDCWRVYRLFCRKRPVVRLYTATIKIPAPVLAHQSRRKLQSEGSELFKQIGQKNLLTKRLPPSQPGQTQRYNKTAHSAASTEGGISKIIGPFSLLYICRRTIPDVWSRSTLCDKMDFFHQSLCDMSF